ncbi:unnamed protein product [Symbiodinium sp. CCMP2592]|nr:unnamed protein product [Symbiodinium sp. CCMP2592]
MVTESPEEEGDEGFMEEFLCAVSGELAYEPCCLSSGTLVSVRNIPTGGFTKDLKYSTSRRSRHESFGRQVRRSLWAAHTLRRRCTWRAQQIFQRGSRWRPGL